MSSNQFPITANWFIASVRCIVAFIWLYEGFWKKIITPDPHELQIVVSASHHFGINGKLVLTAIGLAEVVLSIWVLTGLKHRAAALVQVTILIMMNLSGILLGGGTIQHPADLLIHNMPLLLCMALVGLYGPGAWTMKSPRTDEPETQS